MFPIKIQYYNHETETYSGAKHVKKLYDVAYFLKKREGKIVGCYTLYCAPCIAPFVEALLDPKKILLYPKKLIREKYIEPAYQDGYEKGFRDGRDYSDCLTKQESETIAKKDSDSSLRKTVVIKV